MCVLATAWACVHAHAGGQHARSGNPVAPPGHALEGSPRALKRRRPNVHLKVPCNTPASEALPRRVAPGRAGRPFPPCPHCPAALLPLVPCPTPPPAPAACQLNLSQGMQLAHS